MSDRPTLHFSSSRPPRGGRLARRLGWAALVLVVLAGLWALVLAALWGYAWWRLAPEPVAGLEQQESSLGPSGVAAPADATTVLVTMTGPVDPTVPRPPELAGPVVLVQAGPAREEPAVLVLPGRLPVTVDGEGELTLDEVQREGGAELLVPALRDYTGVRIDHVVSFSIDALPALVDVLGPVEICDGSGCSRPDGEQLTTRLLTAEGDDLVRLTGDVVTGLAARLDTRWVATSPLRARRLVDVLEREVSTDLGLRGLRALELSERLAPLPTLDLDELPLVLDGDGEVVPLHEPAMIRFQHLRQGTPLAGSGADEQELEEELRSTPRVAVLNGAGVDGLAARVDGQLSSAGFDVVGTGNAATFGREQTVVQYLDEESGTAYAAEQLAAELGDVTLESLASAPEFEDEAVDVLVIVGRDLADE